MEEVVELVQDLDYGMCNLLGDEAGSSEAMEFLRLFERTLLGLLGAEEAFEKVVGEKPGDFVKDVREWRLMRLFCADEYDPRRHGPRTWSIN